ncbi:uncharacterized protein C8Q71DRAFT_888903 [Rhodofomes roseus]|uniref:DUF6534 domain-containing protein n=1 Tax=Rhodofomes roseus TaxID=34475 RepID=A0ABQ8JYP0_9APHY|nr:uncharacterized protein C8Q71DRAFT_888903 [Rhodofomes roseus]KAH9829394.1 hypothetical protein C8Q71DRAFT_888903 [Rhodofomes roseus]
MGGNHGSPDTSAIGGVFVEIIFSMIVYGFTLAQTLYYLWNYPGDSIGLKIMVIVLWALDTIRAMLVTNDEWWHLVRNHANATALEELQGFFIHNIWKLMAQKSGQLVLTSIAVTFTVLSAGKRFFVCSQESTNNISAYYIAAGFVFAYESTINISISIRLSAVIPSGSVQAIAALLTDLYITVSLCLILQGAKSHTADGAHTVLSRLIIYTVNRGLLVVVVQFVQFITYIPQWHDIHMIVDMFHLHEPSCTVYVNALLAVLNVRQHLREKHRAISWLWEKPPGISISEDLIHGERDTAHTDVTSPSSSFFSLLGRKRRHTLVALDILVTREVIVDGQLSTFDSDAMTAFEGPRFFGSLSGDKPLSRSRTV